MEFPLIFFPLTPLSFPLSLCLGCSIQSQRRIAPESHTHVSASDISAGTSTAVALLVHMTQGTNSHSYTHSYSPFFAVRHCFYVHITFLQPSVPNMHLLANEQSSYVHINVSTHAKLNDWIQWLNSRCKQLSVSVVFPLLWVYLYIWPQTVCPCEVIGLESALISWV